MQNQDIWNFYGSLSLNNGKLTGYFRKPLKYAIVSNTTHFDNFYSVLNERKNALV